METIVFYSSNTNHFEKESLELFTFPTNADFLTEFSNSHSDCKIYVVTQKPGMFLLDLHNDEVSTKASNVEYIILNEEADYQKMAQIIIDLKPTKVFAISFYVAPYDWLTCKDALISEILIENGIYSVCNNLETSLICFDKNKTHDFLSSINMNVAKSVYVHHQLYWCAGSKRAVNENIYKEAVLSQIKKLNFPVVIKDTVGLSSYGMEIVSTYGEAKSFLDSKRNNSDRIVEEFIEGINFGLEVYESNGNYTILPPFMFSVNKYGITSPKQSIKIGPISDSKYKIDELNSMILEVCKKLNIKGIAQFDLIFSNEKWYIVEINPRFSGMSQTYSAWLNSSIFDNVLNPVEICKNKKEICLNIKLELMDYSALEELKKLNYIKYISQTKNLKARQEREKGYLEVVIGNCKSSLELEEKLNELKEKFPTEIDENFYNNAKLLTKTLNF